MYRVTRRRATAFGAALVLAMGFGVVAATSASAAAVTASCVKTGDWKTGFEGSCKITNGGSTAVAWTVEFDLTGGAITSSWDSTRASAGNHYTFTGTGWNKEVGANSSVTFGFLGSGSPTISGCKVNGGSCDGGGNPGDTQKPTVPTGLASTGKTATSVSLAWKASTDNVGVTGYTVYQDGQAVGTVSGLNHTVTGLTANTSYSFQVSAKDAAGNESDKSATVSVTTSGGGGDTQKPSTPGNLRSTGKSSSSVSLAWNASTDNVGVTGYTVYSGGSAVATAGNVTTATVTGLSGSTAYTFTVRAKDAAGNESADSNAVSVTTDSGGPNPNPGAKMKLGYFTQWGVYGRNYHVKNLVTSGSAAKLTHINYAFGNVTNGQCVLGDTYADYDRFYQANESVDGVADTWDQGALRGSFNQLRKLKKLHPQIKVVFSFGGWTWSGGFPQAAANPTAFANSCYALLKDPRWADVFDGIDIDWEYPNACGLSCDTSSGYSGFKNLMAALRAKFGSSYILSAAITADGSDGGKIEKADYAGAGQYVNYYLPMTYDFFGAFAPQGPTAMHSPLTSWSTQPQAGFDSAAAIAKLKSRGVPANKMALGIGFYGRGWTGVTQKEPGGKATGAAPGTYEPGIEDYKVLVNTCPANGTAAGTAYAHCGQNWWSYDTPATIQSKMAWAKQQGLAGAFFWEFSGDTANGSLMNAIHSGLG